MLSYTPNNDEGHKRLITKLEHLLQHLDMRPHLVPRNLFVGNRIPLAGVAHQNGTIRFGRDPKTSALDVNCKAHDVDNLYVVDGSFFPSSGAVNPALTIMANALRVGDHLLERLGAPTRRVDGGDWHERRSDCVAHRRLRAARCVSELAGGARPPPARRHRCASTAVDSIGMTVSDMDRAVDFYTRVLPFEKVSDLEVSGPRRTSC